MSSSRKLRQNLSNRDRLILEHVARYRLTTLEALGRVVLPELSNNALSKITGRLCKLGFLKKYTLVHPQKYIILGERGVRCLGVGAHRAKALGSQSLPNEFALLAFATLGASQHLRLNAVEVRQHCPWLPLSLAMAPHFLDDAGIVELVRVDLGGPAHHVARKCAADLSTRGRIAEFSSFVAAHRFRLVVITISTGKSTAIKNALKNHHWPDGLAIHFSVVPQLLSIGARENHA